MESFQKALYKQQNTNPTQRIYSPEEMKLFTDIHSPGLEHVVPLIFYQYHVFRSGDLNLYEKVMAQIAIIFICWRRRHYNKSILSFLSDFAYQCKHLPEYWWKKVSILKLVTEKKVEVWHSVLWRNTENFNDAQSIEDTAKSIAKPGFLNDFMQFFIPQYQRGHAEPNLWLIAGKTAELLLDLFWSVSRNCQNSRQVILLRPRYLTNYYNFMI